MKKIILLIAVIMLFTLTGCNKEEAVSLNEKIAEVEKNLPEAELPEEETTEEEATEEATEDTSTEDTSTEDTSTGSGNEEEEEIEEENIEGKVVSILTGLYITEEESKKRPIVVMMDNQYRARPQAGLSDADIVYEILAEGTITRYMAVFQSKSPAVIGPVRSSRPYYIERALEYNPLYVHVGGSMQALADIKSYQMGDIDGMSVAAGVFYRTSHKNAPHNAYTSTDKIRNEADRKKHYKEVEFEGLQISNNRYELDGSSAKDVLVQYKAPSATDSKGYSIAFKYDEENKNYLRYVNGEKHLDEETKIHLSADNIIIQKVSHKVIDKEGRKQLDMVSNGEGYYVNKGVYIDIKWEKTSARNQTKYFLQDGSELILNPGVTWIEVIKTTSEPNFE